VIKCYDTRPIFIILGLTPFLIATTIFLSALPSASGRGQEVAIKSDPAAFAHLPRDKRAFMSKVVGAAEESTKHQVRYDPAYVKISYPNGDVPADTGVCSDVVIRAYRKVGVDLQKDVHEDMKKNFKLYPRNWGATATDTNIDHRRVPNLITFFSRKGTKLPVTSKAKDYKPGDLVTQIVPPNLPHIVIVTDIRVPDTDRYYIVHNIGAGPQIEDRLFEFRITGHFRYFGVK
jgi:uncharacterized protein